MSKVSSESNSFDKLFEQAVGKSIVVYTTSGKAMKGVLRSYDKSSIRMDNQKGKEGGTAVDRSIIATAALE